MRSRNKMALRNHLSSLGYIPIKGVWVGLKGERKKIKKDGNYFFIKEVKHECECEC